MRMPLPVFILGDWGGNIILRGFTSGTFVDEIFGVDENYLII